MQQTIDETLRRRQKQMAYNIEHNISPRQIVKSRESILGQSSVAENNKSRNALPYVDERAAGVAADPVIQYMKADQLEKQIINTRKKMEKAAKDLDFIEAARLRDEMYALENLLKERKKE
jgi:excinuclease ABC subunit B